MIGYVIENASTIHQAYELLSRYRQLVFDETLFHLNINKQTAQLSLRRDPTADANHSRPLVEYLFSSVLKLVGDLTSGKGKNSHYLQRVEFRFALPPKSDIRVYQKALRCNDIAFECAENALIFDPKVLQLPVSWADPELLKLLQAQADQELKKLATENELMQKVEAAIRRRMLGSHPSLVKVAEDCAMSRATLQRKLNQTGHSFQSLLDKIRYATAKQMLAESDASIGHIAFVLGYADGAAFYHAFKRWTNTTPNRYRKQFANKA